MSSLLQSPGRSSSGKHEIFLEDENTQVTCSQCKQNHGKLYRIWRKPAGMFGCWVLWRVNGSKHPLDLSVPTHVQRDLNNKLPKDAIALTEEESAIYWHTP